MPGHIPELQEDNHHRKQQVLAILFAILMSFVYLRISQLGGRLAEDLTYDDVGYANDAAQRLILVSKHGFLAFLHSFAQNPPHSPFSTLLAVGAFAIGGLDDFALYSSNILLLILIAVFIASELRRARTGILLLALAIVLFSPLAYRTIHDFRPDIALGFGTALMVWWYSTGLVTGQPKLFRRAGYALGACLLIKPSFFAHTLAIALFLIGLSVFARFLRRHALRWIPIVTIRDIASFFGLGILIAAPYYITNGRHIFQYFWDNTRGSQAEIWSFASDTPLIKLFRAYLWDQDLTFHLLGYHLVFSIILLPLCTGLLIIHGAKRDAARIVGVFITALVSLCIIVVGRHKNEFFLAPFQWMILLSTVFAIAAVDRQLRERTSKFLLQSITLTGLGLAIWMNGAIVHWGNSPDALRSSSWNQRIVDIIRQHQESTIASNKRQDKPKVFLSFAGPVGAETISWLGMREGFRMEVFDYHRSADIALAKSSAESADYVVLPNTLTSNYYTWLPSASIQAPMLEWVIGNNRFKPLAPLSSNARYFVFANIPHIEAASESTVRVDSLASLEGFLNEEGPYPQWSLPKVRWMSTEKARICAFHTSGEPHQVTLSFRADKKGKFEVFDESRNSLAGIELTPGQFQNVSFMSTPIQGKDCLTFSVALRAPTDPIRLLLFSKIELRSKR